MSDIHDDFLTSSESLTQDLIDFAQNPKKHSHITDVSVVISRSSKTTVSPDNGAISTVLHGNGTSVAITLYCGQKKLAFTQNGLNKAALKKAISDNAILIQHLPDNKFSGLIDASMVHADQAQDSLDLYDPNSVSLDDLKTYALSLEHAALSQPNVISSNRTTISNVSAQNFKRSTNGLARHDKRTSFSASAEIIAEDPVHHHMEVEGNGAHAIHFADMPDATALGSDIGQAANAKLNMITPQTGNMPVVFSHDASETFFNTVLSALDAGAVYSQRTFLRDQLNQQVMAPAVTLIDNPAIKRSPASQNTDSAGIKSAEITFIEKGVLKTFNRNVTESRQIGMDPIGRENGPTNIFVKPGELSRDELIADITDGIYIVDFVGGTANLNDGTHSREALGLMIKDGKITDQSVGGFIVAGNLKDMFMSVTLANDVTPLPHYQHSMSVPTLRFDELTIAGA